MHPAMKRNPSLMKILSITVSNATVALLTRTIAHGFITAKMAGQASDHAEGGNIMTVTDEIVTIKLTVDLENQNQVIKLFSFFNPLLKVFYFMPALLFSMIIYNHTHTAYRDYNPIILRYLIIFYPKNFGIALCQRS